MAIVLEDQISDSADVNTSATTHSLTLAGGNASVGDVIVALFTLATPDYSKALSCADDGGNTYTSLGDQVVTGQSRRIAGWYTVVTSGADQVTVTFSTTSSTLLRKLAVFRLSGVDAVTPLAGTTVCTEVLANTTHTYTFTATAANAYLVAGIYGSTGTYTRDTNWTAAATAWPATNSALGLRAATSTGAYAWAPTTAQAEDTAGLVAGFAPTGSSPPAGLSINIGEVQVGYGELG